MKYVKGKINIDKIEAIDEYFEKYAISNQQITKNIPKKIFIPNI